MHSFLKIGGLNPFSAGDYPGKLAVVVFVQGCPWRCMYCHNPHLQPRLKQAPLCWKNDVLSLLKRRVGLVDAVVFCGGEPTLDFALSTAIDDVRQLGFQVGLHTAGIYPKRLDHVLDRVDWIGLDIKAPFDVRYDTITRVPNSARSIRMAIETVLRMGIECECRTTIHPELLTEDDIRVLAHSLATMGVRCYALQHFRARGCDNEMLNTARWTNFPSLDLLTELKSLFPKFCFRE